MTTRDPFQFVWDVPDKGYRWIKATELTAEPRSGWFLVPANDRGGRRYQPLTETPLLFEDFAEVPPTRNDILSFAAQYGWLGEQVLIRKLGKGRVVKGDRLETWVWETRKMREAVALWDAAHRRAVTRLRQWIIWEDENTVCYDPGPESRPGLPVSFSKFVRFSRSKHPEVFKRIHRDELIQPAWLFLQRVINDSLIGQVSPVVLWDGDEPKQYLMPQNLLGALWLQLQQSWLRGRPPVHCEFCGKLIPVTRSTKKFCTDSCRAQASQRKQAGTKPARRKK